MSTCKLPIILAYSGFDLTAADVARLSPGRWLNDQLVGMYFAFMQAELFGDQPYLFVPPMVSKLLKDGAANAEEFLVPLGSATKTLIFFAVNNHEGNSQGGEHWNLVVFSKGEKTFFDFDSSRPGNATATRKLVEKLALALNCGQTRLVAVNCRQQMNSFDCGCFVLAHAQWIANHVKAHVTVADVGLLPAGMADAKRAEMQNLIGMMAEIYKQSEDVIEEVIDKKPRQFLLLTDLHPSAPLDFKLDDKMIPHKAIEAAAEKLKMKIAKAPRLSKSPRAFSISTELLREFIAMRINLRMDHDALHAGNILSSSMVQVTLERGTNQKAAYDEFLMIQCPFGCDSKLIGNPKHSTCCLKTLFQHFKQNSCCAVDYGYLISEPAVVEQDRNGNLKRRHSQSDSCKPHLKPLTVQAPPEVHEAITFIVQQPVDVILGIAESLRLLQIEKEQM